MTDPVREFWDQQAAEHGAADTATAPDSAYRELEIGRIIEHLRDGETVLDVGCGNGHSTARFAAAFPHTTFYGVDYSEPMIAEACKRVIGGLNAAFQCADVRKLSIGTTLRYDTIISERCLINLKDWDEQKHALLEMRKVLKPRGRIILIENFTDGLERLNELRRQSGLTDIKMRWHNRYLCMSEFESFAWKHFKIENAENIGNLYYIISRVVYPVLAKAEGKEPEYGHPINKIAARLPSLGYIHGYSPNWLHVLRKP